MPTKNDDILGDFEDDSSEPRESDAIQAELRIRSSRQGSRCVSKSSLRDSRVRGPVETLSHRSTSPNTWPEALAPGCTRDLVMAPVTVNKVRKWFVRATSRAPGCPGALVLTGPPGTGKSTAVRLVADELNCELSEWQAPYVPEGSQSSTRALFESIQDFLVGVQYPSLVAPSQHRKSEDSAPVRSEEHNRVLLLDDLPLSLSESVLSSRGRDWGRFLGRAIETCEYPTVMIISDASKARAAYVRALGLDLHASPNVLTVNVPPATENAMYRALTAAARYQNRELLPDSLNVLVQSSQGDVRAALNSLHMYSMHRGDQVPVSSDRLKVTGRRSKHGKAVKRRRLRHQMETVDHVPGIGSDASLDTFHAVSKVLNNKRLGNGMSKYDPEKVLFDSRAEPGAFVSFLHQNYPRFVSQIRDVAKVLELVSESDFMLQWRQDDVSRVFLSECAASIVTRGFLIHNLEPIRTGWRPVQGPESNSVRQAANRFLSDARHDVLSTVGNSLVPRRALTTDFLPCRSAMQHDQEPVGSRIQDGRKASMSAYSYQLDVKRVVPPGDCPSTAEAVELAMIEEAQCAERRGEKGVSGGKHGLSELPMVAISNLPGSAKAVNMHEDIEDWTD